MGQFEGKVVAITGGGSGIGFGIAQACAREGMKIIICDLRQERIDEKVAELKAMGAEAAGMQMDVSKEASHINLAKYAKDTFGSIYMVVNCAGIGIHKKFEYYTDNDWNYTLNTNLWSVIYSMRTFLPIFDAQEEGGYMVNISSMGGLTGTMSTSAYCASKFAINGICQSVFRERVMAGEDDKTHIVIVCPGLVATNVETDDAEKARPAEFKNETDKRSEFDENVMTWYKHACSMDAVAEDPESTKSPEEIGQIVMQGIKDGKMWILTHENLKPSVIQNAEEIVSGYQYM